MRENSKFMCDELRMCSHPFQEHTITLQNCTVIVVITTTALIISNIALIIVIGAVLFNPTMQ